MNGTGLLKALLLTAAISGFLFSKDVFISFQYRVKNFQIVYSNFECSAAMTGLNSERIFLFSIPCSGDELSCCRKHKDEIIKYLLHNEIILTSSDSLHTGSLNSYSNITYIPRRFDIIINNDTAYFYLKGDE